MQNMVRPIAINRLLPHPLNANRMSEAVFKKLVRNIERTGRYEPIVVRKHPKTEASYEIINGHHRVKALRQLGLEEADCVVWEVDDAEAAILLATLNRLTGADVLDKKIELLTRLREDFGVGELTKLLPQTKRQIEALFNLKIPNVFSGPDVKAFAKPLVFFVTAEQSQIIERALSMAVKHCCGETKATRRAEAIVMIVSGYASR